ncbi:peptidoglycan recognition protein [Kitasatospora sp. DSM 101779]|uniref:peptidoglycan recognition protein family protein n=1 Tax=Kitasatospora sp. DSM 101779 TaxID=2853165 RepID=UPI0021D917B9|nr:peptidoglycan recognition protein [Kitasatospora sp. DSM 101779]MCU7826264.1 peptidoglycan recognition protein [Kitasatospora sp. DSM 101779]
MDINRRLVLRRALQAVAAGAVTALPATARPRRSVALDGPPAAAVPPAAAALPVPAEPPIVLRSTWQSGEGAPQVQYDRTVRAVLVHHTDDLNSYTADEVPDILRAIRRDHLEFRGWDDIGYNFLVDRFGRIWEGRLGGVDRPVVGAHTMGFNRDTVGIAAIGTYNAGTEVPQAVVDSIARLAAWKLGMHGVRADGRSELTSTNSGSRFPVGATHAFNAISGHRDAFCTLCPGESLYAAIPGIIDRARSLQQEAAGGAPQARAATQTGLTA